MFFYAFSEVDSEFGVRSFIQDYLKDILSRVIFKFINSQFARYCKLFWFKNQKNPIE